MGKHLYPHAFRTGRRFESCWTPTEAAAQRAVDAGTVDFEIETIWTEKVIDVDGRPMFVEGTAVAVASGRPNLD